MSQIDRLGLQGVRSFHPKNQCIIDFWTPLTLIVGANGCGKTTIIEALKYVTTGNMPPGTGKGIGFVHDPKLGTDAIVDAQVRLKFTNEKRNTCIVTRSMRVTQKAKIASFSTVEGSLLMKDSVTKEQTSLSSKCADLDTEIPSQLGVTKAVLDSVIFCHQEDSSWPLSDSAALKGKFDAIFSSTRYSKALDDIRSLRKKKVSELNLSIKDLERLSGDLEMANKLNRQITRSEHKLEQISEDADKLDRELLAITDRSQELLNFHVEWEKNEREIQRMERDRQSLIDLKGELETRTEKLDVDDDTLKRMLANLINNANDSTAELNEHLFAKKEAEELRSELQSEAKNVSKKMGQLQAEVDTYKRNQNLLETAIEQICQVNKLKRVAGSRPKDFLKQLQDQLDASMNTYNAEKADLQQVEYSARSVLNELQQRKEVEEQMQRAQDRQKEELKSKSRTLQGQVDHNDIMMFDLVDMQGELQEDEELLRPIQLDIKQFDERNEMASLKEEHEKCVGEQKRLTKELSTASNGSASRTKLDVRKAELRKAAENYEKLQRAVKPALQSMQLDKETRPKAKLLVEIEQTSHELERITQQVSRTIAENTSAQALMKSLSERLRNAQLQVAAFETEMLAMDLGSPPIEFELILKRCGEDTQKSQKTVSELTAFASFYAQVQETSRSQSICGLCERSFKSKTTLDHFLDNMDKKMLETPKNIEEAQKCLNSSLQTLERLREAHPRFLRSEQSRTVEIPSLSDQLISLQKAQSDAQRLYENLSSQLQSTELTLKEMRLLLTRLEDLETKHTELEKCKTDVAMMQEELEVLGQANASVEDISGGLKDCQERSRVILEQIDNLQKSRDQKEKQKNFYEKRWKEHRERIIHLERGMTDHAKIKQEMEQISVSLAEVESDIQSRGRKVAEIDPQISEQRKALDDAVQKLYVLSNTHTSNYRALETRYLELQSMNREIQRYESGCIELDLANVTNELDNVEAKIDAVDLDLQKLQEQAATIEKQLSDRKGNERTIQDNIRLRKLEEELIASTRNIEATVVAASSQQDALAWKREIKELNQKHLSLQTERGALSGTSGQLKEQLKVDRQTLEDRYDSTEKDHNEIFVACQLAKLANSDLDKTAKALDSAIMKFHSIKMQEINQIIQELWANTYMGVDIDSVQIRSEADTSSATRRYNYRVVMLKNGIELDMRGRCSAGQKVLACIIVRLALAETFCINCGVLALDEPTTNLDAENVLALAKSLNTIISNRQRQRNFQLIIITHDEDFLNMLGKGDWADYYWRVYKDEDGYSNIERCEIHLS